jgi:serine/threonine-protein kinase
MDGSGDASENAPTRPSTTVAAAPRSESNVSEASVPSLSTPGETLHVQEIARTRVFMRVAIGLAFLQLAAIGIVRGDEVMRYVFLVALSIVVGACGWLLVLLRDESGYTVRRALVAAYACVFGGFAGIAFYGVFSPAAVIIPFGLFFFSTGQHARATLSVFATCCVLYAALGIGIALGLVDDRGLVHADALRVADKLLIVFLVELIFIGTYLIARVTRTATLDAIARHDLALKGLSQRDALLKEARQEIAQAMQAGARGRYTGETLGSFRLGEVIGRGAMGEVYEAKRTSDGAEAAVKLLHPQLLADPELVQRFLRESRAVATLACPNVVALFEASRPDAPVPYLAMERLYGNDLAEYLHDHKRMPLRRVLTLLRQVGVGLDAARAAGIVHRDLKPRNLFLAKSGEDEIWKILDFGVSKLGSAEATLTHDNIIGTPAYMAPEQAQAGQVDHRADLFAMGVIAYRALTGRPPFTGDSSVEILYKVVHAMPPQPSEIAPLPAQVDVVLAIALAKRPKDRFDSAAELALALDAASRGRLDLATLARGEALLEVMPWGFEG